MANKFIIKGTLPNLNDYTSACRMNRYAGAKMKGQSEHAISIYLGALKNKKNTWKYPIIIKIDWYEKNNRRDADNVVFAKKFILDSMVEHNVIESDSRNYVIGFIETIQTDKNNPRIEVEIIESEKVA